MNYIINTKEKTIEFLEQVKVEDILPLLSNFKDYTLVPHIVFSVSERVTIFPQSPTIPFCPVFPYGEPLKVWCNV